MTTMPASSLEQMGVEPFVITRRFDASRDRVWQTWTERKHLMQWFGPKGFTMPAAKMDFRPGGSFHHCLCAPNGDETWGKWVFREIIAPKKIVLVHSFSDEDGGVTRHPFASTWPLETLSAVTFTECGGKTLLTIERVPLNPTDEELKAFEVASDDKAQGWSGTFEQLDNYLARV